MLATSGRNLAGRIRKDARLGVMREYLASGKLPYFRLIESAAGSWSVIEGRQKLMFAANNYLGLCGDPRLIEAANDATNRYGPSCSSTPPLCGTFKIKAELEALLADWYGTEDALVYTSGYQANVGAITALLGAGDIAYPDSEAHASIHNGIRLSGASARSFAHNDIEALEHVLTRTAERTGTKLVAVDGLYSMQGDVAPIAEIVSVCAKHNAAILIDEAHSVGVFGQRRTGVAEEFGCLADIEVMMGALSKGPASTGGYIAGSRDLIDLLRVHSDAHIFSTTAAPSAIAAGIASVLIMRSEEGAQRAQAALANARRLRDGLQAQGLQVGAEVTRADGTKAVAPNVAVHIGPEPRAIAIWNYIFDHDVYCALALPPAVRENGALIRCGVSAAHSAKDIDQAVDVIANAFASTTLSEDQP